MHKRSRINRTRRRQRGGSNHLVFYTCYFGPSGNVADTIPEKPSTKYKCYFFSNNRDTLKGAEARGFLAVYVDTPIKTTNRDNAVDSKELKACPHHFAELQGYTYTCYYDSKRHVTEADVEEFIRAEMKDPVIMMLNMHPTNQSSVWREYENGMHQERYAVNGAKYNSLIRSKLAQGMKNITEHHYETNFIVRKSGHMAEKIGEEWLSDIQATGAECQITFFFVQQKYNKYVKPFSRYYGKK